MGKGEGAGDSRYLPHICCDGILKNFLGSMTGFVDGFVLTVSSWLLASRSDPVYVNIYMVLRSTSV